MADQVADFLSTWVEHDQKIITYRLLSRELRIHVDEAKRSLQAYYDSCLSTQRTEAEPPRPHATFILIGELKPADAQVERGASATKAGEHPTQHADESQASSASRAGPTPSFLSSRLSAKQLDRETAKRGILLASEAKLQETKARFSKLTSCHIYSLQPGPLKDVALLTSIQHELHTKAKYVETWTHTDRGRELGVIAAQSIKDNFDPTKSLPSLAGPSTAALPSAAQSKAGSKAEAPKKEAPPVKRDLSETKVDAKREDEKPAVGKGGSAARRAGLDWSRAKPKSLKPATLSDAKPEAEAKAKGSKRKKVSDEDGDDSIVIANSDEEEERASSRKASSRSRNSRKALLGDDDEDDEGEEQEQEEEEEEEEERGGKVGYDINDDEDDDVQMVDLDPSSAQKAPARGQRAAIAGSGKRADAKTKTKAEADQERKALEDMMDLDDDPDVALADEPSTSMMQGTEMSDEADIGTAPEQKKRVRKQRKVQKKVRKKNERGYLVTEMVDEYESYSSDESDVATPAAALRSRPKTAAAAVSSKAAPSRSKSSSASTTPAPSVPLSRTASNGANSGKRESQPSSTVAAASAGGRKASGGTAAAPKKGQQSLASFFSKKPKDSK